MRILSVDIGFGDVKVILTDDSGRPVKRAVFPTALAVAGQKSVDFPGFQTSVVQFEGREYLVGEDALQESVEKVFATENFLFLLKKVPLFFYKVLRDMGILDDGDAGAVVSLDDLTVVTGLPLAYYGSYKDKFRQILSSFYINGRTVQVPNIRVFAQGQGIYLDCVLDEKGNLTAPDKSLLIVDIGHNTVDILRVVSGRPSREGSDMIERGGVTRVCQELKKYLHAAYQVTVSTQEAKEILKKGSISILGRQMDLREVIDDLLADYCSWLIENIRAVYDDFIKRSDGVVFAGGGARCIERFLPDEWRNICIVPEDPEFANARGYVKFALLSSQSEPDNQK